VPLGAVPDVRGEKLCRSTRREQDDDRFVLAAIETDYLADTTVRHADAVVRVDRLWKYVSKCGELHGCLLLTGVLPLRSIEARVNRSPPTGATAPADVRVRFGGKAEVRPA
jgi:hypothetical protein